LRTVSYIKKMMIGSSIGGKIYIISHSYLGHIKATNCKHSLAYP
jgi:hypothetical protein